MSARSKARKRALDVLYEADQRALAAQPDESLETASRPPAAPPTPTLMSLLADRLLEPGTQTSLPQYAVDIVEGVSAHAERIDEVLTTFAQGWTLARMPAVDRAILRLATWELLYNDEVPDAVAIDEALELARSLSTDESPTFINGLLGRISQLKPSLLD